ncbi:MAG: cell division topological specificity factor MinE [Gammaproteobacteria bacterium]|nr:cell division topological specificity factor MinE [Gammaproteobacteria bacterium]MCB1849438.1 cell division topological specificity factor MinE [Gammaproteobacteria bacterium]MCP5418575.1 cell division topological specificity factor MinE [Chromatiaceae bacterium]
MGLLDFFRQKPQQSASIAKERLQILVAHERAERNSPSYLPKLKEDLLQVISKYVTVDKSAIQMRLENDGNNEILELNIMLPEK